MKTFKIFALIYLIFLAAGCGTSNNVEALKGNKPLFSIVYSENGGFTGMEVKWKLNSNGLIEKTESFPSGKDSTYKAVAVDSAEIYSLKKKLDDINFLEMEYDYAGNITYSLSLMQNKKKHTIRWSAREEGAAPKADKEVLNDIRSYIQKIK